VVIYCEGVPTVVVFEISPSHVKTFHYRPRRSTTTRSYPHAVRLCVGSAESELRRPQVRSRYHVQVQSPILTAREVNTQSFGSGQYYCVLCTVKLNC